MLIRVRGQLINLEGGMQKEKVWEPLLLLLLRAQTRNIKENNLSCTDSSSFLSICLWKRNTVLLHFFINIIQNQNVPNYPPRNELPHIQHLKL